MSDLLPSMGSSASTSAPATTSAAAGTGAASGTGAQAAAAPLEPTAQDYACPDVTVRTGTGTLLVNAPKPAGAEVTPNDVRYQGTFVRFSRECAPRAGTMNMKVGVQGRVITGPAGGPGTVDVPLRVAVVREGPEPKTVLSKFVRLPVTLSGETGFADFMHIEQDVSFPLPKDAAEMESYVVYVGFDPGAAPKPAAPARRRR
jgi:hypothetical protein